MGRNGRVLRTHYGLVAASCLMLAVLPGFEELATRRPASPAWVLASGTLAVVAGLYALCSRRELVADWTDRRRAWWLRVPRGWAEFSARVGSAFWVCWGVLLIGFALSEYL